MFLINIVSFWPLKNKIVNLKDVEIDRENEEPKKNNFERLSICDILATQRKIPKDIECDDNVKASYSLTDRNRRNWLIFVSIDYRKYA